MEPRRPIFIISPIVLGQVGSPTRQWSIFSPLASIQSRSATVPSVASPSSSPVIANTIDPFGGVAATKSIAAAAKAATPDFMSVAPRPYINPSLTSAPKGSTLHASISPTGTTSVCPLNPKVRPFVCPPQRAKRLEVSPRSTRFVEKPASESCFSSNCNAPPSIGVIVGQRINSAVNLTGSVNR